MATERDHADNVASNAGAEGTDSTKETPSAESSSGKVSVAAAIAISLGWSTNRAAILGGTSVNAGGSITVESGGRTRVTSRGDGSAKTSDADATTVGVAVAVTYARTATESVIESGAHVAGNGITTVARNRDGPDADTDPDPHTFEANAVSGASGGKTGVAGSLSIAIIVSTTTAAIDAADADAGTGAVLVNAEYLANTTVSAKAGGFETPAANTGVGASVALSIVDSTTVARIADGTSLTGGDDNTVTATATDKVTTEAIAGGAAKQTAVTPGIAVAVHLVVTDAFVGTSVAGIDNTGAVAVTATQTASATTNAEGDAKGNDTAVGVALGLTYAEHTVRAWFARSVNAGTAAGHGVGVQALGSSTTATTTKAGAAGAPGEGDPGAPTQSDGVDKQIAEQRNFADNTASANGAGTTDPGNSTPQAQTNGQSIKVAAAISVNLAFTRTQAWLADGLTIVAGGQIVVRSSAHTDAKAAADAKAVGKPSAGSSGGSSGGSSSVGVGAAWRSTSAM